MTITHMKVAAKAKSRAVLPRHRVVSGFTLIELLVALAISTVIAIAAMSALFVSRQGFTMADAASQLRDNARFSRDLIQRLAVQSGYKDLIWVAKSPLPPPSSVPNITGFNNAIPSSTDPENSFTIRTGGPGFGSDVLILRFQTSEMSPGPPGPPVSDQSMIDCNGVASKAIPIGPDDRIVSVFSVAVSNNEPTLMCTTKNSSGTWFSRPLITGVENFQVLYGIDSTVAGAVADTYVRADQLTVASSRTIRSLRIGMVIRGPIGSAADSSAQTFYPLGLGKESGTGTPGFAMSTLDSAGSPDKGTRFSPTPDTRLRQVVTFTVHLRNDQGI